MRKNEIIAFALVIVLLVPSCAVNRIGHFGRPQVMDDNLPGDNEDDLTVSPFAEIVTDPSGETKKSKDTTKPKETTSPGTTAPSTTSPKETEPATTEKPTEPKVDYGDIGDFDIGDDDAVDDDDTPYTGEENFIFVDADNYTGKIVVYDVPLPEMKQKYAEDMAAEFGIPVELLFGIMKVESNYDETVISKNGKYIGAMQIAKSNLNRLNKKFGTTDLQDFVQNVQAGAYFISYYYKKYNGDIDKTLMSYHRGEGGAQKKWAEGIYTDSYCTKVKNEMNRIIKAGVK